MARRTFWPGIAAIFAATGLFSQALLGLTHAKDRWLATRFAAERLRCFKFQLFSVLEEVPDAEALAAKVKQRTGEGLAALEQELMGGRSAILEFSPFDVLSPPKKKSAHTSKKLLDEAAAVYDILRFSVEIQHFEDRFRDHDRETKFPSLLSEFSFMAGAVLACIGILDRPVAGGLAPVAYPDRAGSHGMGGFPDLDAVRPQRGGRHLRKRQRPSAECRAIRDLRPRNPAHPDPCDGPYAGELF